MNTAEEWQRYLDSAESLEELRDRLNVFDDWRKALDKDDPVIKEMYIRARHAVLGGINIGALPTFGVRLDGGRLFLGRPGGPDALVYGPPWTIEPR